MFEEVCLYSSERYLKKIFEVVTLSDKGTFCSKLKPSKKFVASLLRLSFVYNKDRLCNKIQQHFQLWMVSLPNIPTKS